MNDNDLNMPKRHSLLPHQEQFLDTYFRKQGINVHCLVAPVGSGSTMTLASLTLALFEQKPSARVLFLADSKALVSMIVQTFESSGLTAIAFDRFKYREFEDALDTGTLLDLKEGVYVSTIQLAAQSDVSNSLRHTSWDLVIVDSNFRRDTRSGEFISQLLSQQEILSAVVTVNTLSPEMLVCLPEPVSVTEWNLRNLVSSTGEPLWHPGKAQLELIPYRLTLDECETRHILDNISSLTKKFKTSDDGSNPFLPVQFPSDAYNSEIRLRFLHSSLTQLRNRAAHGLNDDLPAGITIAELVEILGLIEHAFSMLDRQESDSRLEALANRLKHLTGDTRKIIITTIFRATAEYLTSSLQSDFESVSLLTSSVPTDEIGNSINRFREYGGILIMTEAMLNGMALPDADLLVPYEAPKTSEKALRLLGRFLRVSRESKLTILMLTEETKNSPEGISETLAMREALKELGTSS